VRPARTPSHPCCPRRAALIAAGCLLTVAAAVLYAHEGHAPIAAKGAEVDREKGYLALTADARSAVDVKTAAVEPHPVEGRVLAYATVVAPWRNHAFATAVLAGRVVKVHVTPGQQVRAGDILAEVQSLELDDLQQDLLTARTEIRLSERVAAELRKSADAGAVSAQAVLDAETRLAQSRNALDVARAKWLGLGLPADRLDDLLDRGEPVAGLTLPIRSPVSGVVARVEPTAGKVVEPAEPLAEVIDLSTVWVRVGVLEKDLPRVAVGQPAEVRLVAYPGEVFRTTVTAVNPFLDPVTNVITAWAELANPSGTEPRFQPGMAGQAYLVVREEVSRPSGLVAVTGHPAMAVPLTVRPRPSVPAAAVLREGAERFVLVEEASTAGSSEYRKVPVVPGRESGGRVEVLAGGVYTGDRVVTRGAHLLGHFFTPEVLRLSPEAARTIGLKVEPARAAAVDEVVTLDGAVEVPPARRGSASSQLAGTIRAIRVGPGDRVRAGEVVAEVFSSELLSAEQEFLRVHLEAALTSQTLESWKRIPGAAARRLWELESQLTGLRARRDTLRRKLAASGLTPDQIDRVIERKELTTAVPVRAAVGGIVASFEKVLGQAVAPHEPLVQVHDPAGAWVRGFVPERDIGRIRLGQPARVRLVADPGFVGTGRVVRSGRAFAADARSVSVWVELDEQPPRPLLHNQFAALAVVVGRRPPALAVPRSAVVTDGAAAFLFVQKPDGAFDRRAVETGPDDDRFVTITRGLAEGEPVAVGGATELMTAFASLR
jgi:cobalt-zinc-cadmium efflux system membrane fusion protein